MSRILCVCGVLALFVLFPLDAFAQVPATPTGVDAYGFTAAAYIVWDPVSNATGYRVLRRMATTTPTQVSSSGNDYFIDFDVTNGVTYYYSVCAYNASGSSAPSKEIGVTPLAVPTLTSPVDGVFIEDAPLTFTWTPVPGAKGYWFSIGSYPYGYNTFSVETGPPNTYTVHNLLPGLYYWSVVAITDNSMSDDSDSYSFVYSGGPPQIYVSPLSLTFDQPNQSTLAEVTLSAPQSGEPRESQDLLLEAALAPGTAAKSDTSSPAFPSATRTRPIQINPVVQTTADIRPGDRLNLNLFSDARYEATVDNVKSDVNDTVIVRGRLDAYPLSSLVLTTSDGHTLGKVAIPEEKKQFAIRWLEADGTHYLLDIDAKRADILPDGPALIPPATAIRGAAPQAQVQAGPMDPATVGIMVVYTPAARQLANSYMGGINSVIAQALENGQLALDNSQTLLDLQLVHSAEVNYAETVYNSEVDLVRLTETNDGYLDQVHALRDEYGADLVAFFVECEDVGGVGFMMGSASGTPDYGFCLIRVQQAADTTTAIHELGHNMGCGHSKYQNFQAGPGLFPYSAGWRWTGTDGDMYCTVMTYEYGEFFPDGIDATSVPYFSNPSVLYQGVATGHATNGDNARTLRETKHVVAGYRQDTITDTGQFTIDNNGTGTLFVTSMDLNAPAPWISWTPAAPFSVPPDGKRTVRVVVNHPLAPPGQSVRRLLVGSNDADKSPYPGGVNITVNNAGPTSTVQFRSPNCVVTEGAGFVRLYVTRTGVTTGAANVGFTTVNGTANAAFDYSGVSGTLSWAAGSAADKYIDVPILNDTVMEDNETFTVLLRNAVGADIGSTYVMSVRIQGPNDVPPHVLHLNGPNGGESWPAGSSQSILWSSENVTGNVQIRLYSGGTDAANLVSVIAESTENTGSFEWYVPARLPAADNYKVGISEVSGTAVDFSDACFAVTPRPNAAPAAPLPVTPASGAQNVALTLTLQAGPFSDPDGDAHAATEWQIARYNTFADPVLDVQNAATGIAVPAGVLQQYARYFWRARYKDDFEAWSPWSTVRYFDTGNRVPATPTLLAPAQGTPNAGVTPTLQAGAFYDPDGDRHTASRWQVATDSRFANIVFNPPATSTALIGLTVPAGALQPYKRYFWRVQYKDHRGAWSSFSAPFAFDTGNRAPEKPTLLSPEDKAPNMGLTPTLQTGPFTDPDGDTHAASRWQVARNSAFTDIAYDSWAATNARTSVTVPAGRLQAYKRYFWRAQFKDSRGLWGSWATPRFFDTGNRPPEAPTLVSPANEAQEVSLTPTLQAGPFADPDGDTQFSSHWQVSSNSDFTAVVFDSSGPTVTPTTRAVAAGRLTQGTLYYWRARYRDSRMMWSDWSSVFSFRTRWPKIHEEALPLGTQAAPERSVAPTQTLAIRLRIDVPVDPSSVWARAESGNWQEEGGVWLAVEGADNCDGWVVFKPSSSLPADSIVTVTVGAQDIDGNDVEPIAQEYRVSEATADLPSARTLHLSEAPYVTPLEQPRTLEGLNVVPLSQQFSVGPEGAFDKPLTVWIPIERTIPAEGVELWYFSDSRLHRGWYPAAQVEGWVLPDSQGLVQDAGVTYLEVQVTHSGTVQIMAPPPAKR